MYNKKTIIQKRVKLIVQIVGIFTHMEQNATEQLSKLLLYLAPHELGSITDANNFDMRHVQFVKGLLISGIHLNKVEVNPSAIHGLGIFAKQKLLKNDLITIYPAHYISFHRNVKVGSYLGNCCGEITDNIKKSYAYHINKHYVIYGQPDLTRNPAYLGHMINDGAKGHSTKNVYNQTDAFLYYKVSMALRNAEFVVLGGLLVAVLATRDIDPGEEILTSYGYKYWMGVNTQ
jgi:hypothetical protein